MKAKIYNSWDELRQAGAVDSLKKIEYQRNYYIKNRERLRQYRREYYRKNRAARLAYQLAYKASHSTPKVKRREIRPAPRRQPPD